MKKLYCITGSDEPMLLFVDNRNQAAYISGDDFRKHYGEPLTKEAAADRDFQKITNHETAAEAAAANCMDYRLIFFFPEEYKSIEEL